jgi:two-component system sensor histidine kinase VicK
MQFKNKKLKLKKNIKKLPAIKIDKKLMRIILDNLLSNAIKYTPAGGVISVKMKKHRNEALISVTDTGCGIPQKQHSQIFSKLFRADNNLKSETKGSGLGLYIVKAATKQYGGKVWFKSQENKGTTFYLTVPLKGMKEKEKIQEKLFGINS